MLPIQDMFFSVHEAFITAHGMSNLSVPILLTEIANPTINRETSTPMVYDQTIQT